MKNNLSKIVCTLIFLMSAGFIYSQENTTKGTFDYTFYIDAYYSYDFSNPPDHNRPDFLYQYNRHDQFGINMAMAKVNYTRGRLTANLGINTGDFPAANMAHERELLRILYEANIGYYVSDKVEFTVGMFSSHMGFESALSFDNLLASHSLASEWTPYYLMGAKVEYTPIKELLLGFTVANGNQAITEYSWNTNKLIGIQVNYAPSESVTFNYSNMYYNDMPDSSSNFIFYNNFYGTVKVNKYLEFIYGFDYAIAENRDDMYVSSLLLKYSINKKFAVAGRYEYYNDPGGIYINTSSEVGFVCNGYSLNFDYSPMKELKVRIEGRIFDTIDATYYNSGAHLDTNSNLLLTLQAKF